ncbi:DDE-type integrase/transposase/recombinase [Nodosilinea nodulosa]|uniref:DDE-type integrase/transposase/recombinase n=1 Tax=Nodosilinea nodulosa TaxID=416001 RepID=UPI0002F46844|nr:DDE-type integrase/transposase/recombinase [Nodosilinea nodulosa]
MSEHEAEGTALLRAIATDDSSAEGQPQSARALLTEQIEDLDAKRKLILKLDAVEDIIQSSGSQKRDKIRLWSDRCGKHPETIKKWVREAEKEGIASIARTTRSDAGILKGSSRWKHSVDYWRDFILKIYAAGKKAGLGITRNTVNNQLIAHAELDLGLKRGEFPSHMFVYKVLDPIIASKPRVRNPGQGPNIIVKVTDGTKKDGKHVQEDIEVIRSNQVWQVDHTRLDNLLTDGQKEASGLAGCVWITAVVDTYSSLVMGYYLSYDSAGSHEVTLALRQAILKKDGPEYKNLRKEWEACGLPEYIVTDRAKEFKSAHLRHAASDLGIKLRLRLYTEQGGIVERLFLALKTEFAALINGYKGGNLNERPDHPEKKACITFEEYEQKLVRHIVDHHNQHFHDREKDKTLTQRWISGLPEFKPRMPSSERDLDICLLKTTKRKVQERGTVECFTLHYTACLRKDDNGHWKHDLSANFLKPYEGKEVTLRYDPRNIVYVLIFSKECEGEPSKYLGSLRARELLGERLSLREWEQEKAKIREKRQKVDQSSILAEQQALFQESVGEAKSLRSRRRKESKRLSKKQQPSNVIPLHQKNPSQPDSPSSQIEPAPILNEVDNTAKKSSLLNVPSRPPLFVVEDWNKFTEDW